MVAPRRLELDLLVIRAVTMVAAVVLAGTGARPGDAQQASREYEIKAAFLVNFVRLTQWPDADSTSHRTICVLGESPFGTALSALEGKSAGGRTIKTHADVTISEARTCNVLFISSSETTQISSVLDSLAGSSVLTVGEMQGFAEAGGMVAMPVHRNRILLELNISAVREAGLFMSSQLLGLAEVVR